MEKANSTVVQHAVLVSLMGPRKIFSLFKCISLLIGGVFILGACAITDVSTDLKARDGTARNKFSANEYILTKMIKRDANERLLVLETAQLDLDKNEIHYFRESRADASIQRSKVRYSREGNLIRRRILDENNALLRAESIQYDKLNRIQGALINEFVQGTTSVRVERFEYDGDRLVKRTVTSSPAAEILESDTHIYLPSGQIDARISQRMIDGQVSWSWVRFDFDANGQITGRILGDGNNPGVNVTGYEFYDYDDSNNISAITEMNADEETTAVSRFEYQHVRERAYNRLQRTLALFL